MLKLQPDIVGFLSDSILKQRYNPPSYALLNKDVEEFCMYSKSINIYRTFLVNQRYIINCIIVDTVLNSLAPKQAQFVVYKYKHNQSLTWISAKLNVSTRIIQTWNKHINKHIQNMLFYDLDSDELFYSQALINMINILDLRIDSVLLGAKLGININTKWLGELCRKREFYRKVVQHLAECCAHPDDSLYNWVISCKCRYPTLPINDFATRAAINKSTIYRHLNRFSELTKDLWPKN